MTKILESKLDETVNYLVTSENAFYEARLVVREDKLIIYVSSQDGCSQACRMCYLTAMRHKKYEDASVATIILQIEKILAIATQRDLAPKRVHINFMSRGEPLASEVVLSSIHTIETEAMRMVIKAFPGAELKLIVSTILPKKLLSKTDHKLFLTKNTHIYYSLYSTNMTFRKKWLPNSMSLSDARLFLNQFYWKTGKSPRLHFCFIMNENDDYKSLKGVCEFVNSFEFDMDINIVRYNPYSEKYGKETSIDLIRKNVLFLTKNTNSRVKIVNRVGIDVKASCGMFIGNDVYSN